MSPENFCYWLQGYFEIVKHIDHREGLSKEAVQVIEDHLKEVFDKRTPNRDNGIQQPTQGPNTSTPYPLPKIDWPTFRTMELKPSDMPGITPAIIC